MFPGKHGGLPLEFWLVDLLWSAQHPLEQGTGQNQVDTHKGTLIFKISSGWQILIDLLAPWNDLFIIFQK